MRIGINVRAYRPGVMGGLGDYFRCLMAELSASENEFVLYTAPWNHDLLPFDGLNCSKILSEEPTEKRSLMRKLIELLPPLTSRRERVFPGPEDRLDLWFCPFTALEPGRLDLPSVVTIPDVQHKSFPEFFSTEELASRQAYFPPTCRNANALIAISSFTKGEICRCFGVADSKIHVVHLGASERFSQPAVGLSELRARLGLPSEFVFYPANDWPHKNHETLLTALHLLALNGLHIPVVFTGFPTSPNDRLKDIEKQFEITALHLGYVSSEDLVGVYQSARIMAFPSLYEGFGMPVIEAMAAGVPVAASNTTALPETGGDAVAYFDPHNPYEIADTIRRLWCDETLRSELTRRGRQRAKCFTWKETARKTLEVFEAARQGRGSS